MVNPPMHPLRPRAFTRATRLLTLLACVTASACAMAQTLSVTVSKNPVAVGEQFQVTFALNASGSGFTGPSFDDFIVLGGPNASTSIQIINGSMSQTQTFSYYLRARSEGTFPIGSASIVSNGRKYESPPFTIEVVKGSGQVQQPDRQQPSDDGTVADEDVFIRATIDRERVLRGQGLVATYKLYTRVSLVNYAVTKAPALNGFWTQDIQLPSQLNLTTEVIRGVQYHVGVLKKVVLYPQQSGTLTVDPMEGEVIARVKVSRRRNAQDPFDIFNDPFFSNPFGFGSVRDVKVKLRSNALKVRVDALPPNAPATFKGSVGRFTFEAGLDRKETRENDPVTLRIRIKGNGNLNLIDPPDPSFPPDVESYDPKVIDQFATTASGTAGTKTFEYLLIPRHAGTYTIEPVAFTYFDPDNRKYQTLSSPSFTLIVQRAEGGSGGGATVIAAPSKSDVQVLGSDIRFIRTGKTVFLHAGRGFYGSPVFWSLSLSPVFLFVGLFFFKRNRDRRNADRLAVRSRRANRMAQKRMAAARKLLDGGDTARFFDETANAIWGFLSDKLAIPVAALSRESAREGLVARQVGTDDIDAVMKALDDCELARFAAAQGVDAGTTYTEAVRILSALETKLKA